MRRAQIALGSFTRLACGEKRTGNVNRIFTRKMPQAVRDQGAAGRRERVHVNGGTGQLNGNRSAFYGTVGLKICLGEVAVGLLCRDGFLSDKVANRISGRNDFQGVGQTRVMECCSRFNDRTTRSEEVRCVGGGRQNGGHNLAEKILIGRDGDAVAGGVCGGLNQFAERQTGAPFMQFLKADAKSRGCRGGRADMEGLGGGAEIHQNLLDTLFARLPAGQRRLREEINDGNLACAAVAHGGKIRHRPASTEPARTRMPWPARQWPHRLQIRHPAGHWRKLRRSTGGRPQRRLWAWCCSSWFRP